MNKLKKIGLIILILGYLGAGFNHFRVPDFYISIIPGYFPHPAILNIIAGICEIGFAMLLIFLKTREVGAWGIVFLLIAFISVHMQMVREHPYMLGAVKIDPVLA